MKSMFTLQQYSNDFKYEIKIEWKWRRIQIEMRRVIKKIKIFWAHWWRLEWHFFASDKNDWKGGIGMCLDSMFNELLMRVQ